MKAIRIDKEQVIHGSTHVNLVFKFMEVKSMAHDQMDKMIEDGRIEFGSVFLNQKGELEWEGDETRDNVYTSIERLIDIGGWPPAMKGYEQC